MNSVALWRIWTLIVDYNPFWFWLHFVTQSSYQLLHFISSDHAIPLHWRTAKKGILSYSTGSFGPYFILGRAWFRFNTVWWSITRSWLLCLVEFSVLRNNFYKILSYKKNTLELMSLCLKNCLEFFDYLVLKSNR